MSVPNWLNDAAPFPHGEHGAFNPAGDPSIAFMQTPTSASFDPSQLQYQQMQHRMQNGNTRNASPASQSPMYPTQNVVPAKRPRPREDSIGASPQQYPGGLPAARSQTPQGAYPGYQPGSMNGGPQYPGASAYQQFQQPNTNLNQSPIMQNQPFNPQGPNPGAPAMSPSPFSPAVQNFGAQTTPPQSDHGSRVNTPQGGRQTYSQGLPYGANPTAGLPMSASVNGSSNPQMHNPTAMNPQQQQMYDASKMRQMHQVQPNGMGIPQRQPGPMMKPLGQPMNAMQNYQMAQVRQQAQVQAQAAQAQQRPNGMDHMLRQMIQFMQARGAPFNPQPVIASKPMNCVHIFMCGMKMGGSRIIQAQNRWPQVAHMLSFPQAQLMVAAQEIQAYWNGNLIQWEQNWQMQSAQSHHQQQQQQQQQQRQRAMAENTRAMNTAPNMEPSLRQGSFSPTKQIQDLQGHRLMQPPVQVQNLPQTPTRPGVALQQDPRQVLQNGYRMQQAQQQGRPPAAYGMQAPNGRQGPAQPSTQHQLSASKAKSKDIPLGQETDEVIMLKSPRKLEHYYTPSVHALDPSINPKHASDENQINGSGINGSNANDDDDEVQSSKKDARPNHHGGLPISDLWFQDTLHGLLKYKHTMPQLNELGVIDIRALILSIKSGIHGEVRLALDVIAALSLGSPPPLNDCDELLDTLVDCANDQIELLAEGSRKTSDVLQIPSYQEEVRGFNTQSYMLQDIPDVGSLSYDLERAANRLVCITTILRNFSLSLLPESFESLREPNVLRMMTVAIRYLGTRKLFLRTHQNTLDFGKDLVVFLSSLSPSINLTSKDEALSILHFLLSFAPEPRPNAHGNEIIFASYVPAMHRYFPQAIDSLAKLLARDPNRSLYRSIFASDSAASPPFDLLTRAFGLAIAAIPDTLNPKELEAIIAVRHAVLAQSLLSAELLISMIPTSEHDLAYSWRKSQDGFALKLRTIVLTLAKSPALEHQRHRDGRVRADDDVHAGFKMIHARGSVLLRKLEERALEMESFAKDMSSSVFPRKQPII